MFLVVVGLSMHYHCSGAAKGKCVLRQKPMPVQQNGSARDSTKGVIM